MKLFPHLVETRSAPPEVPAEMAAMDTQQFFGSLDWQADTWEDGNMVSVLAYARGNCSLNLGSWRQYFLQSYDQIKHDWSHGLLARVGIPTAAICPVQIQGNPMDVGMWRISFFDRPEPWLRHWKRVCYPGFFPGLSQWNQFSWGNLSKKGPHQKTRSFSQAFYTFDMFQQCFNKFLIGLS